MIGRFQPFHLGHLAALRFALEKAENLWVGLGSSNQPIQKENPFTAKERRDMVLDSIDEEIRKRIMIFDIPDLQNHQRWVENIDTIVPPYEIIFTNDELTQYLYKKRGLDVMPIPFTERDILSGTNIRYLIKQDKEWQHLVPTGTREILKKIGAKERLRRL